ncbi:trafficking protein particle complex subunit 4 [Skeletonema marinoi]|uniref:Trafficking protein particle complex subunit n=1 Tax=Skeletonema marinoi TaxID=267567 RepID=A0AAD8YC13_9STRA|nr:trafficking protein particle complex subunit 4 [Skeletonema marinoi]
MGFLHLFIVNKSGGLILHRPLGPSAPKINTNDWLRIGSTFHSLHAIAAEASPVKLPGNKNPGENRVYVLYFELLQSATYIAVRIKVCSSHLVCCTSINTTNVLAGADDGIEEIEGGGVILKCLQTRTGIKFVLTAEPGTADLDSVLREIYVLYSECALKDPFYELEMPIRCELFTLAVDGLIERLESGGVKSR